MEPFIMPLHSSSPPPLDEDDGDDKSEEDEFGAFGQFAVADSAQPSCGSNRVVKQSQPASTVNSGLDRGESGERLTNGFSERGCSSRTQAASPQGAGSPREETGFADFTVFSEQAPHPWCCGFTPASSAGQWDGGGTDSSGPGRDVVMDSEPRPHGLKGCTTVNHCEGGDAPPSQDHLREPQEAAADSPSRPGKPEDGQSERKHSLDALQTLEMRFDAELEREDRDESISAVPQTFSLYESASEDLPSFCDDLSFDGPSLDLEPNVSSLASGDQTEWDQTDEEVEEAGEEEEELRNYGNSGSFLTQSKAEESFQDQSATQETSTTSTQPQDSFTGSRDCSLEHHRGRGGHSQLADAAVQSLGNLPPSDSFADFCSAPTLEDGEASWAEFKDPRAEDETRLKEQVSSTSADGGAGSEGQSGDSRRSSCQESLCGRVQQILVASFPEVDAEAVEGEEEEEEEEEEVLSLGGLLHGGDLPESEEEETQRLGSQWMEWGMWWPHQDLHSAVGLRFQWGGSHTNRTLLRCLGVDTKNIVFVGTKKQPLAVPAFASSLGMLEPTKDSAVPAVCSPAHTAVTAPAPPAAIQDHSADPVQGAPPSSHPDWHSRGLSSSQDGCSALNLDYFGAEEENRSCSSSGSSSSSSRSGSPPPGVDPELYELAVSKVDTGALSSHMEDSLNRLMSAAEKTSTSVRKPQQDSELSAEACRVISVLPNLSFMRAKVLMFPSVLVPEKKRFSDV